MSDSNNPPQGPDGLPSEGQVPPPGGEVPPYGQPDYGHQPPYGQPGYGQPNYGQQPPYGGPPPGGSPTPGAPFSPTDSFVWAWKQFTANVGVMIVLGLLIIIPSAVASASFSFTAGGTSNSFSLFAFSPLATVASIIGTLISFIFVAGTAKVALAAARGGAVSLNDAFALNWPHVLVAGAIYAVAFEVGSLLCVLPGIVAAFLLLFSPVIAAEGTGSDGLLAIKRSFELTTGQFGPSILVALLALVTMVVGVIACCIGVFVAAPIAVFALTHTYLHLSGQGVAPTA